MVEALHPADDEEMQRAIEEMRQKEFAINPITLAKMNIPVHLAARKKEDLPPEAQPVCDQISPWLDVFCARKTKERFITLSGPRSDIMAALVAKGIWVRRRRVYMVSGTEIAEWLQGYGRDEVMRKLVEEDVLVIRNPIPITTNRFEQEDAIGLLSMAVVRRFENRSPVFFCATGLAEVENYYANPFMRIAEYKDQVKVFKWSAE